MDYAAVTAQMDDIYGEQAHIPESIFSELVKIYPELFQGKFEEEGLKGHLIILPFNEKGMEKITDFENDEGDFEVTDFELNPTPETPVYFFVYSIYGQTQRYSIQMIKLMVQGIKTWTARVSSGSFIFAECVSPEGVRLSEKLGLRLYHSYNFRGTDLHLYKTGLQNFGLIFSSL